MHINEDHFIAEIINPTPGKFCPKALSGSFVFTSITKEAFPRSATAHGISVILPAKPCSCGRTHVKMCKPMGRSDDMLIVKASTSSRPRLKQFLSIEVTPANYQIVVDRVKNSDTLEVQVEMTNEMFSDNLGAVASREKENWLTRSNPCWASMPMSNLSTPKPLPEAKARPSVSSTSANSINPGG